MRFTLLLSSHMENKCVAYKLSWNLRKSTFAFPKLLVQSFFTHLQVHFNVEARIMEIMRGAVCVVGKLLRGTGHQKQSRVVSSVKCQYTTRLQAEQLFNYWSNF